MLKMRMVYDDEARKSGKGSLMVYGVGNFPVLSGRTTHVNDPNCEYLADEGFIPVGRYWIVDALKGGVYTQARRQFLDFLHNINHAQWFGLFNSQTINDYTFVNGTKRTGFRLHPVRPDGSGKSWGGITLFRASDFEHIRKALLRVNKVKVPRPCSGPMNMSMPWGELIMPNALFMKATFAIIYLVVAMLLIKFIAPLNNLVFSLGSWLFFKLDSGGLGLIGSDYQWGEDPATLCVALASLVLLAWLISRILKLVIYRW
ncbi:DUF2778 domain-containing protein [Erwinia tasmaniensis]|nr:DUF2778 domain-containing protein [Erwinia tasmaniensis]